MSNNILENPHAMVGMRIFSKSRGWDWTIEKVTQPYFYPYAVCLDHKDRPDLWTISYDQNDALHCSTHPSIICKEHCAYCIAELIAYGHVDVSQHNGNANW